ncbi:MAG: YbhB/YbcL family Raf kinase inhibitor-like protein [Desulfobacterales bacterium]
MKNKINSSVYWGVFFTIIFATLPVSRVEGGTMELTSMAFSEGAMIPGKYTCDGADVSPPLNWGALPPGTKSLALICDDPDAPVGTWVHWVYYDIPAEREGLPENIATDERPAQGGTQGINDFRKIGYGGPCPPGGTHRYYFKLYALDTILNLSAGATKKQVLKAMENHVIGQTQLMGKYRR